MTDADLVPQGADRQLDFFEAQLSKTRVTRSRRSGDVLLSELRLRPAFSSRSKAVYGDRWVMIGDAASTYDPLSGRGVVAALEKGVGLARAVCNSTDLHHAISAYADAERATFEDYLGLRKATYQRVRQWKTEPFWRRRH